MRESSGQHLFHTGIIISPLYPTDPKLSVIRPLRFSFFKYDHRADCLETADIGYVICFHSGYLRQIQKTCDLLHGTDGSPFFAADPLFILIQHHLRIFLGKLHQLLLLTLLRHTNMHLLTFPLAQPALDNFRFSDLILHHDLSGNIRSSCIKLLHKCCQDLFFLIICRNVQTKMISSDETSIPDKEHLYHRIFPVFRHGDHIFIFHITVRDLLFLRDLLHTSQQFPIFNGFLKLHLFCRLLHLLFQFFQNGSIISIEKM